MINNQTARALIAHINGEIIDHQDTIKGSDNYEEDFDILSSYLKEDEPRYIIYKHEDNDSENAKYLFILFVPDIAKVRSKMMYASSAAALQKKLGGPGTFSSTIYWTELQEVSRKGWESHKAHEALAAPLTQEEESLRNVREKEATQMLGTTATRTHLPSSVFQGSGGSSVGMKLSKNAEEALQQLQGNPGSVVLIIDIPTETVDVKTVTSGKIDGSAFATDSAQFTVYNKDGNDNSVVVFYTCPSGTKVKERMIYATNFKSIKEHVTASGLSIASSVSIIFFFFY